MVDARRWFAYGNKSSHNGRTARIQYEPTAFEHCANILTHGVPIAPCLYGIYIMLLRSSDNTQFYSALIYGLSLLCMFSVSTTFHTLSLLKRHSCWRRLFHYGDRAVVYLFISGSYTPWLLNRDFDGLGHWVFYLVWLLAFVGIVYQMLFHERYFALEVLLYVAIATLPATILTRHLLVRGEGVTELAFGGLLYLVGLVFFVSDGVIPCAHAVWHCFVTLGAMLHFVAINRYLIVQPGDHWLHQRF